MHPPRRHDRIIFAYALLGGAPAVAIALAWIWSGSHTADLEFTLTLVVVGCWLGFSIALRERVIWPLQVMANLLMALREGDFTIRARGASRKDPLGEAMVEINALGSVLRVQRQRAVEATALLGTVMEEIEVAVFAFDAEGTVRLVNRAGQSLLDLPRERILGRSAAEVGLAECLEGERSRLLGTTAFPGGQGRWEMRRSQFRENGRPHQLVVVADLSQPLREEELAAWQRLVRVLGHELNNSLAPIKSIAGSLGSAMRREPRPADWEEDMRTGLEIIATRAEGLTRFLEAYSKLARLPAPVTAPFDLAVLIKRAAALESRLPVALLGGPPVTLVGDAAQIEQALINLIKNAVEAVLERSSDHDQAGVRVAWARAGSSLEIRIEDDGPGVAQTGNLFVPFFTTKSEGSGIGLVLCRQIAENHRGSIELRNRAQGPGCLAILRLPLP